MLEGAWLPGKGWALPGPPEALEALLPTLIWILSHSRLFINNPNVLVAAREFLTGFLSHFHWIPLRDLLAGGSPLHHSVGRQTQTSLNMLLS
jgi:hypothetical protein